MKQILVCKEKNGTEYFDISTKEQLHNACCYVLKKRLDEGWYDYTDDFVNRVKFIISKKYDDLTVWYGKNKDRNHAWNLLVERSTHEYEACSKKTITEINQGEE